MATQKYERSRHCESGTRCEGVILWYMHAPLGALGPSQTHDQCTRNKGRRNYASTTETVEVALKAPARMVWLRCSRLLGPSVFLNAHCTEYYRPMVIQPLLHRAGPRKDCRTARRQSIQSFQLPIFYAALPSKCSGRKLRARELPWPDLHKITYHK